MYYDFCHFQSNPFADTSDPEFLYLSPTHKAALQALSNGIEAHQEFMAFFGAPGLGKTTILRACQARIQPRIPLLFIGYPRLSFRDVLALICQEYGFTCDTDSPTAILSHLYHTAPEKLHQGVHIVLLIDEAHQLPVQTLESLLHLLVLQAATGEKLLQLVLAGLPELQDTLNLPQVRALKKRLDVSITLAPLTAEESRAYICHRLAKVLMPENELFTPGALRRIIRSARGNPRVLNTLCSNMLITGTLSQEKPISAKMAREVIADLGVNRSHQYSGRVAVAVVSLLLMVGLAWGWQSQWLRNLSIGALELSHLTQRFADVFRVSQAEEQPLEVPAKTVSESLHVSEPALPQTQTATATQEPQILPMAEQRMEDRVTQMPVVQPTPGRMLSSPETSDSPARISVQAIAPPPSALATPLPQAATGPGQTSVQVPSMPAVRSLPVRDRELPRASDTPAPMPASPSARQDQASAFPGTPRERTGTRAERNKENPPAHVYRAVATPKMQTVHFHSFPAAATIRINGEVIGRTPVTVQLDLGSHTVLVEKPEYRSITYRLHVDRDGENNLYHNLYIGARDQ